MKTDSWWKENYKAQTSKTVGGIVKSQLKEECYRKHCHGPDDYWGRHTGVKTEFCLTDPMFSMIYYFCPDRP